MCRQNSRCRMARLQHSRETIPLLPASRSRRRNKKMKRPKRLRKNLKKKRSVAGCSVAYLVEKRTRKSTRQKNRTTHSGRRHQPRSSRQISRPLQQLTMCCHGRQCSRPAAILWYLQQAMAELPVRRLWALAAPARLGSYIWYRRRRTSISMSLIPISTLAVQRT